MQTLAEHLLGGPSADGSTESGVSVDRATFFALMSAFPTGVTVITTLDGDGEPRGLTSNAVCSVSADPPLLLACVDKGSQTLPAPQESKKFVVNFLSEGRGGLSNHFASKAPDKFASVVWQPAGNGMPWLRADSLAHIECVTAQEIEAGDHIIFLGRVVGGEPPAPGTHPLMYFRRSYASWPQS